MPKFIVTKNMGSALKNLRQLRKIKAIDIAHSINKTGAFISKLEKGELNSIDEEDFYTIIDTLSKNDTEREEAAKLLFKDASMEYSEDEAANKEWKYTLDTVIRRIPIPAKYVEIVNNEITLLNIDCQELSKYISSNFDLYNDKDFSSEQLDSAPVNKWVFNNGHSFIKLEISTEIIENIINKKVDIANYVTLKSILISIFRLNKLSKNDAYDKAEKILNDLQIFTIEEIIDNMIAFDKMIEIEHISNQQKNDLLSPSDREHYKLLSEITEQIRAFSRIDIKYANQKLEAFVNNLDEDIILTMGYIGVDLSKLKNVDFQIKKDFVKAVSELVNEYSTKVPQKDKPELI